MPTAPQHQPDLNEVLGWLELQPHLDAKVCFAPDVRDEYMGARKNKCLNLRDTKQNPKPLFDHLMRKFAGNTIAMNASRSSPLAIVYGGLRKANCSLTWEFVEDIDAHDGATTLDLEEILAELDQRGIPRPTYVKETGRGYHLVWSINPMASQMAESLAKKFHARMEGIQGLDATSWQRARVFKLPGSPNPKTGTICRIIPEKTTGVVHGIHTLVPDAPSQPLIDEATRRALDAVEEYKAKRKADIATARAIYPDVRWNTALARYRRSTRLSNAEIRAKYKNVGRLPTRSEVEPKATTALSLPTAQEDTGEDWAPITGPHRDALVQRHLIGSDGTDDRGNRRHRVQIDVIRDALHHGVRGVEALLLVFEDWWEEIGDVVGAGYDEAKADFRRAIPCVKKYVKKPGTRTSFDFYMDKVIPHMAEAAQVDERRVREHEVIREAQREEESLRRRGRKRDWSSRHWVLDLIRTTYMVDHEGRGILDKRTLANLVSAVSDPSRGRQLRVGPISQSPSNSHLPKQPIGPKGALGIIHDLVSLGLIETVFLGSRNPRHRVASVFTIPEDRIDTAFLGSLCTLTQEQKNTESERRRQRETLELPEPQVDEQEEAVHRGTGARPAPDEVPAAHEEVALHVPDLDPAAMDDLDRILVRMGIQPVGHESLEHLGVAQPLP